MRHPRAPLLVALAVTALGVAWILWALGSLDIGFRPRRGTAGVPGFVILTLGLWLTLRNLLLVRLRDALLVGEGAIARWQITPFEWEAWRAHDAERSAAFPTLRNKLRIPDAPVPPEGVTVAIGESAVAIGKTIVPLNVTGWAPFAMWRLCDVSLLEGAPASLEFSRFMKSKNGAWIELVRIPVSNAHQQAQSVVEHFSSVIPAPIVERVYGLFPAHFQAKNGDIVTAYDAWHDSSLGDHAALFAMLGLIGLIIWYSMISGRIPSDLNGTADLVLTGSIAVLVLAAALTVLRHWRRDL